MRKIIIKVSPFTMSQTFTYFEDEKQKVNKEYRKVEDAVAAIPGFEEELGEVQEVIIYGGFPGFAKKYIKKIQNQLKNPATYVHTI